MSSNGFMGWVQKNPGTAFAIFLVFAAIVTVIVMVTRGSASSAGPGAASDLPVLEVSGTKVVKSTKTSGYAMKYEYALGEKLGDNIDFTITIDTKSGFEQNKISRLKVFRYGPNAAGEKGELLGTKIINDIKNYGRREVTFLGSDLEEDAVPPEGGKQFFEVIGYVVSDDETETEYIVDPDTPTSVLASTPTDKEAVKISADDLNYVLSGASLTKFTWIVGGASKLGVEKSDALKSKYTLSIEPTKPVLLIPVKGSTTNEYTFQFADGSGPFTVDDVTVFKLDQPTKGEEVYLLYATKNGIESIVTRTDGTGALVLEDPRKMSGTEFTTAKVAISPYPPPVVRYLRFAKLVDKTDPVDRSITVSEVYVYDTAGVNLTTYQPLTVTFSETDPSYQTLFPKTALFDDKNNLFTTGTQDAGDTQPQQQWFEIDLGMETDIGAITVVNRDAQTSWWNRLVDIQVLFKDSSGQIVHTSPAITETGAKAGPYHTYRTSTESWTHVATRPTLAVPTGPTTITVGDPVKCTSNSPDETAIDLNTTRSIVFEGNVLRPIPTDAIGFSWHPDWFAGARGIDCSGYSKGDNLTMKT